MQKYLIRFSYFGTHFRGLQIQSRRTRDDLQTVQGILEAGLRFLRPANEPVAHTSSRTDSGVHAFENCLHVELLRSGGRSPYDPSYITHHLNTFLRAAAVDIRVKSTHSVSAAFDARHCAVKRHYLYRIATLKDPLLDEDDYDGENCYPLAELDRVFLVRKAVDMTKLVEGCALLQRTADFASFMAAPAKTAKPNENTVKNMEKVSLSPGQPMMDASFDPAYSKLNFYNISFTSQSFLHNQIRRCVSVLLALAQGVITKDQVEHMFQDPRPANAPAGVNLAPPCGLYLLKVDFPDHVLQPDYCGEAQVSDQVLRWVEVRRRVRTMAALGYSNLQKENRIVDTYCAALRKLNNLRDTLLKQSVLTEVSNEQSSTENKNGDCLPSCNENISNVETVNNKIELLSKLEKQSHDCDKNDGEEDSSSIDDSREEFFIRGPEKRKMLDELYTLLITRDEIDEKMQALMEPLIRSNLMRRNTYDETAMEKTISDIIETMRLDSEKKIKKAKINKQYELKRRRKTLNKV